MVRLPARSTWEAELQLQFDYRDDRTVLRSWQGRGPLVVQKPLYPESDDGICHIYLIHPPGGVVGGDSLQLKVYLAKQACPGFADHTWGDQVLPQCQ